MKLKNLIFSVGLLLMTLNAYSTLANDTDSINSDSNIVINPWAKLSVSFGGFFLRNANGITFGSQKLGVGIQINLEDALDLEVQSAAFRGQLNYRFGKTKRHQASFGYFSNNRKSTKTLTVDLDLNGYIIPIGTEISSWYNYAIIRVKYDYAFYQDDRVSLGASIGFFVMPISFSVSALNHQGTTTNFIAPLPAVGLRSEFIITEKFYLTSSAEILYFTYDNFTGSIMDLNFALEYRPIPHFGMGLGVNSFMGEFTATTDSFFDLGFFGNMRSGYTGANLFIRYTL